MIDRARERFATLAFAEATRPELGTANGSRAWFHDDVTDNAVVLLHGFTNNPRQYAVLGAQLFADGHNVIVPRFPFHGYADRMTGALASMVADDWLEAALGAVTIAAHAGRRVTVVGISVAGTVATWLAMHVAIDTAIAISPFFGVRFLPARTNDTFAAVTRALPNAFVWWDPFRREAQLPLHAYPRFSTHALGHALAIGQSLEATHGRRAAGRRLMLVLNAREPAVNNAVSRRRVNALQRSGLVVATIERDDLPAMHDIIEPSVPETPVEIVYPLLRGLIALP